MAKKPMFSVSGIEETERLLANIAPQKARNLNRSVNLAVAATVGKKIRELAPKEEGDLKKSIKWRRRRTRNPDKPKSIVFVGKSRNNYIPFYWRFLEHGRGGDSPISPLNFVSRSVEILRPQYKKIYQEQFVKKLEQLIKREKKKAAKK